MKNAIKHRGPDDDDIYLSGFLNNNGFSDKTEFPNNIIGGFVGFAHSRLSIRDIKRRTSANDTGLQKSQSYNCL